MIDTLHLLPPDLGPRSNPMLYGVAQAIAELFPPVVLVPRPCEDDSLEPSVIESTATNTEGAAAV